MVHRKKDERKIRRKNSHSSKNVKRRNEERRESIDTNTDPIPGPSREYQEDTIRGNKKNSRNSNNKMQLNSGRFQSLTLSPRYIYCKLVLK